MEPGQVFTRDNWTKAIAQHGPIIDRRDGPGGTEILTFADNSRVTVAYTPGKTLADARFTVQSVEQASGSNPEQDRVAQFFSEHGAVRSVKELPEREIGGSVVKRPVRRYEFQDGAILELAPPVMDAQGNVRDPQSIINITLPKDTAQVESGAPPRERNNSGRREQWNPETKAWEDIGPAISASATASAQGGTIVNAGGGRILLVKPDGTSQVIEEGRNVESDQGTVVNLGKRGVFIIGKDGSSQQIIPEEAPEPRERPRLQDPESKQWIEKDDDGVWRPIQVEGAGVDRPKSLASWRPDASQQGWGLFDRYDYLTGLIGQDIDGKPFTREQAKGIFDDEYRLAKEEAERFTKTADLQSTGRTQDVSLSTNRLSNATTGFTNALSFASNLTPADPSLGRTILPALLALHKEQATSMGGLNEIPQIPALQQLTGMAPPRPITVRSGDTIVEIPTGSASAPAASFGGIQSDEALQSRSPAPPGMGWSGGQLRTQSSPEMLPALYQLDPSYGQQTAPAEILPALNHLDPVFGPVHSQADRMINEWGEDPEIINQARRELLMGI